MQNKKMYELTNPQKSIWLTEQYYSNTAINNICGSLLVKENLNVELFNLAINKFVENNDSFRLHFTLNDGTPYQYLVPNEFINFEVINLNNEKEIDQVAEKIVKVPFNFYDSRLFDFKIFKLKNGFGGFIVNVHHIISDAATLSFVGTEIADIYASLINNDEIPSKSFSYIDYINSEKDYLKSNRFEKDKEYWNNLLSPLPEVATIPSSKTEEDSPIAHRMEFTFGKELLEKINAFCKENKISMYNFLIAIYSIYISRINNMDVFTLGTPILNRTNFAEKHTSGMFISTSILKINTQNNPSFIEFTQNIAKDCMGMLRHQKYNYQHIVEDFRKNNKNLPNLYDISLSYQITKATNSSISIPYECTWYGTPYIGHSLDIHFHDNNDNGNLIIAYDYKICKYSMDDIDDIHYRIISIINQILYNNYISINDIEVITPSEKNTILYEFNHTTANYPNNITIIQLFKEQVKKTPNNIAVNFKNDKLTYAELNEKSDQLANYLIDIGIKEQDRVCLFFKNSIELVISILAVLKSGACYIPIDVNYPLERIKYIIDNSNTSKILCNKFDCIKLEELSSRILVLDLNQLDKFSKQSIDKSKSTNTAYIIYTSGSTGKPKGVEILHSNLVNYIFWAKKQYVGNEITNFPLYSSISFDLTVTSVFTPIISGYTIYIYENMNPQLLLQEIVSDNNVQIIKLTPAHLVLLKDCIHGPCSIKKLILGGDILNTEICKQITKLFNGKITIYNEYGPTETTVGCMIYQYTTNDNYTSVPIGTPIDNTSILILDKHLHILPYNCKGELYISGKSVGNGYINNPKLTQEKFLTNPYFPNELMYKTGDIAKLHKTHIIEYIGRSDFQVKINGYRIELGEIQSKLLSYPSIKDCYITVLESDNSKKLCAYYVSNQIIKPIELKHFLASSLPSYMIPQHFVALEVMPMTINGKIDKSSLPKPTIQENHQFIAPQNDLQQLIHDLICSIININKISINDDFFEYGVDSLAIIKLQTSLYSKGYLLNTQIFYEYTTIQKLADYILLHKKTQSHTDIQSNTKSNFPEIKDIQHLIPQNRKENKNILLLGSTGFLGAHILYSLLTKTNYNIYCIIREKDTFNSVERMYNTLSFYFKDISINEYAERLHIITGNLLRKHFELPEDVYQNLGTTIDCVIDSVAIVKHYGNYQLFHNLNVSGTEKVVDFCIEYNIPLHYISTLSVSGYGLVKTPVCDFCEYDLFIGQDYTNNVYVRSKLEAENLILNACKNKNLIASIYRLGNITNRFSDGCFQKNFTDNAFINRISSFINIRLYP